MTSREKTPYRDSDKLVTLLLKKCMGGISMPFLNELQKGCFLTENDGVPGCELEGDPNNYTVDQLKRWLKCREQNLS